MSIICAAALAVSRSHGTILCTGQCAWAAVIRSGSSTARAHVPRIGIARSYGARRSATGAADVLLGSRTNT